MTNFQYWGLWTVLFAILVVAVIGAVRLAQLHADNVVFQFEREVNRRRNQARDIAEMMMRLGPDTLPQDVVDRMFGGVAEMFGKENTTSNGDTQHD